MTSSPSPPTMVTPGAAEDRLSLPARATTQAPAAVLVYWSGFGLSVMTWLEDWEQHAIPTQVGSGAGVVDGAQPPVPPEPPVPPLPPEPPAPPEPAVPPDPEDASRASVEASPPSG